VEALVLGTQFDPTLSLQLNRQRHADLIAEAQHEELVQAALDYSMTHVPSHVKITQGRLSRGTAFVLTGLRHSLGGGAQLEPVVTD
jgi:hypothetical protein